MDATVDPAPAQFGLTEEQRAIQEMAEAFAADRVAPNALDWDRNRHFPADITQFPRGCSCNCVCVEAIRRRDERKECAAASTDQTARRWKIHCVACNPWRNPRISKTSAR